jgi:hypothetical protein
LTDPFGNEPNEPNEPNMYPLPPLGPRCPGTRDDWQDQRDQCYRNVDRVVEHDRKALKQFCSGLGLVIGIGAGVIQPGRIIARAIVKKGLTTGFIAKQLAKHAMGKGGGLANEILKALTLGGLTKLACNLAVDTYYDKKKERGHAYCEGMYGWCCHTDPFPELPGGFNDDPWPASKVQGGGQGMEPGAMSAE